jgi:hypothetical protein
LVLARCNSNVTPLAARLTRRVFGPPAGKDQQIILIDDWTFIRFSTGYSQSRARSSDLK